MEKVFLFSRSDAKWERTRNVQIRISDKLPTTGMTMFSGGEALGPFPGPATRGQTIEIPSGAGWEKKDWSLCYHPDENGGRWRLSEPT